MKNQKIYSNSEKIAYYRSRIQAAQKFIEFASRRIEQIEIQELKLETKKLLEEIREKREKNQKTKKGKGA